MRPITVLVLGAAALVAAAGAAVTLAGQAPTTQLAKGQRLFPNLAERLGTAQTIEITRGETTFALQRKGDSWVLPGKSDYPARADQVRRTLVGLAELELVEAKTAQAALHGRLDLADAGKAEAKSVQVTVKDGQGAVLAALLVGKRRTPPLGAAAPPAGSEMVYVRKAGEPQTWLVLGQLELRDAAVDWADRQVLDVSQDKLLTVELTPSAGEPFQVFRDTVEAKDFGLRPLPEGQAIKDQWNVNGIASALEGLSFDDVAKASDLAGVAPKATARFTTADGLVVTAQLLPKGEETWAAFTAEGTGDATVEAGRLNDRLKPWVYKLPDFKRDRIDAKLADLIQPKPAS